MKHNYYFTVGTRIEIETGACQIQLVFSVAGQNTEVLLSPEQAEDLGRSLVTAGMRGKMDQALFSAVEGWVAQVAASGKQQGKSLPLTEKRAARELFEELLNGMGRAKQKNEPYSLPHETTKH
jgi:hypothetical protein